MRFCVVFEVAGPFRWVKVEKAGRFRRLMFAWFSVSVFPYKWTEFLRLYRIAAEEQRKEVMQHDLMQGIKNKSFYDHISRDYGKTSD